MLRVRQRLLRAARPPRLQPHEPLGDPLSRDSRLSTKCHLALFLGAVPPPDGGREASCVAVEVDEDPISSLVLQALNRNGEMRSLAAWLIADPALSMLGRISRSSCMTERFRNGEANGSTVNPNPDRSDDRVASRPRASSSSIASNTAFFALRRSTVAEPQVSLFRGDAFSFDTLGDTIADRFVDVAPILKRA